MGRYVFSSRFRTFPVRITWAASVAILMFDIQNLTSSSLHSKGKGIASSAIPYSRTPPAWLKTTPDQVTDQICKLAKKGYVQIAHRSIDRDATRFQNLTIITVPPPVRSVLSSVTATVLPRSATSLVSYDLTPSRHANFFQNED